MESTIFSNSSSTLTNLEKNNMVNMEYKDELTSIPTNHNFFINNINTLLQQQQLQQFQQQKLVHQQIQKQEIIMQQLHFQQQSSPIQYINSPAKSDSMESIQSPALSIADTNSSSMNEKMKQSALNSSCSSIKSNVMELVIENNENTNQSIQCGIINTSSIKNLTSSANSNQVYCSTPTSMDSVILTPVSPADSSKSVCSIKNISSSNDCQFQIINQFINSCKLENLMNNDSMLVDESNQTIKKRKRKQNTTKNITTNKKNLKTTNNRRTNNRTNKQTILNNFINLDQFGLDDSSCSSSNLNSENCSINYVEKNKLNSNEKPSQKQRQRRAANERERKRMSAINSAFSKLREALHCQEEKLSKMQVLQMAQNYILNLATKLNQLNFNHVNSH